MLFKHAIFLVLAVTTTHSYLLEDLTIPYYYTINLNLPQEVFTNASNTYTGDVSTEIIFTTNNTQYILLHAQHDFIQINRISFNGSEVASANYNINNITDILNITIPGPPDLNSNYILSIEFTGRLSTSDMYGFYKSHYVDANGTTRYLATTQFEPTYARRAFPCFDEPSLKATFDFSITVPSSLNVLFNTLQNSSVTNTTTGMTTIVFNTTPQMSTYLFAVIVSEFTCTQGVSIGSAPYQVCSRNETADTRQLALQVGPQILTSLGNFTNYDYSIAMPKMDQVAIPDFAAGAMENWGLVTYRETAILWSMNDSSNRYQQRVVTVIAHEFAHQWFGNLVTMGWWSEIFLNEGFATYFEYHTAHEVFPSWQLDKQFVIEELHAALLTDSLETAHALQSNATTPAEINSKFSTISYSKGGSVLRMVAHLMQSENFKAGIQNYILRHQFSNALPEDLWITLNESIAFNVSGLPEDLPTVMENWVNLSGYPVLMVTLNGSQVDISQRRFLLSGGQSLGEWYVPVSYTTSVDSDKFVNTTPRVWLTPTQNLTVTIPANAEWIILNNQQTGYYRVNYDSTLWTRIREALSQTNFSGVTELNRAQIVDDLFNLARAGQIPYSIVLNTVRFLNNDTSYYPWYSAIAGFNFLLRRTGQTSTLGQLLSNDLSQLMSTLYASVPISVSREDDMIYTHTQTLTLNWACKLNNQQCVQAVRVLFNQYQTTGVRPNKNLRSIVYCNALRFSTNNRSDWEFLWNAYLNVGGLATEQITILSALGCTREPVLLREYLNKTITNGSGIRSQDTLIAFQSVYLGSPEGIEVAFEFLMQNYMDISRSYAGFNSLGNLIRGLAEMFTTETQINRLRNFTQSGNLPEAFSIAANEALEVAETNARWLQTYERDLLNYYGVSSTTPSANTTTTSTTHTTHTPTSSSEILIPSFLISYLALSLLSF